MGETHLYFEDSSHSSTHCKKLLRIFKKKKKRNLSLRRNGVTMRHIQLFLLYRLQPEWIKMLCGKMLSNYFHEVDLCPIDKDFRTGKTEK